METLLLQIGQEIQQESYFLTINQFIAVYIPTVGSMLTISYFLFRKIASLQNNSTLKDERYNSIKTDMEKVKARQSQQDVEKYLDSLKFTEALGKINGTLIRMDTTLKHFDETIKEMKALNK